MRLCKELLQGVCLLLERLIILVILLITSYHTLDCSILRLSCKFSSFGDGRFYHCQMVTGINLNVDKFLATRRRKLDDIKALIQFSNAFFFQMILNLLSAHLTTINTWDEVNTPGANGTTHLNTFRSSKYLFKLFYRIFNFIYSKHSA